MFDCVVVVVVVVFVGGIGLGLEWDCTGVFGVGLCIQQGVMMVVLDWDWIGTVMVILEWDYGFNREL